MFFYGYDATTGSCRFCHQCFIQWLNRMDIDDFCLNTICVQTLCRFQRSADTKPGSNNCYIRSFPKHHAFSNLKRIILSVVDDWYRQTSKPEVHRSVILISRTHSSFCLDIITWIDDNHARNRAHQRNILITLMCRTIFSDGNSRMSCSYLYIQVRISDGIADLLKGTACSKHSKGTCEWHHSGGCQTCGNSHHIGFRDTTINVTLRKFFFENSGLGGSCQIRIQNYQIFFFPSKLCQCISIAFTGCNFLCLCHYCSPAFVNSASAISYSSSFGAFPCQPT